MGDVISIAVGIKLIVEALALWVTSTLSTQMKACFKVCQIRNKEVEEGG